MLSGTGGGRSEGDGDDGGAELEFEDEDAGAGGVDDGEVEGPEGCRILSSAGEVVENCRGARSAGATRRDAAVRSIVMRAERWCEVCEGECRELSGPSWSWMKAAAKTGQVAVTGGGVWRKFRPPAGSIR